MGSDITSLVGASSLNDIDDVKYLRDKLFAAIKVPQSYLTNLEGGDEDKTTLAQKDIRFARTIQRLQRSVVAELEKIGVVHLYTLGFRGEDLVGFSLSLNNPSRLAEIQQLEYLRTKFETATGVPEGIYSKRWIATNILGLSDDEFLRNQRETFHDRKYQQALEAVTEQGAEEAALAGGELGGELGGDELGGELGGELGDELGGEELGGDEEGGEESALLTAPARREDIKEDDTRVYGHGTYTPVSVDNRRKGSPGPYRRSLRRAAIGMEVNTYRKNAGSGIGNPRGDMPDPTFGIKRRNESIYTNSENQMIENTIQVRRLVEELEKKEAEKNEAQQET